jgi:phenylalanyl-tRNA synthetase beta subunit
MDRVLTQEEVNQVHCAIGQKAVEELGVEIR